MGEDEGKVMAVRRPGWYAIRGDTGQGDDRSSRELGRGLEENRKGDKTHFSGQNYGGFMEHCKYSSTGMAQQCPLSRSIVTP